MEGQNRWGPVLRLAGLRARGRLGRQRAFQGVFGRLQELVWRFQGALGRLQEVLEGFWDERIDFSMIFQRFGGWPLGGEGHAAGLEPPNSLPLL